MTEIKICPYPGLRPFNENESVFFKGRDEHVDQITRQLEQNKFIMLTGASGDGKSSLVYAGIVPHARAGFFKARFNAWIIADFRPERDPLLQLTRTISAKLKTDEEKTAKELKHGFSSLINLYKSSCFYYDPGSVEYKNEDDETKKKIKGRAANLLIVADQFEEFFTNAENFTGEVPSLNSQTVINLLLETARIALAKDLPVYIICTMRSDYIGQCATFHGLPEFIGFSQFFVPRLKRKEIQQVIEEPAMLGDCKIANRLTQILINELGEGYDQLPVLQHALSQLWHEADNGNEEMDLLHLTRLGGMNAALLPEDNKQNFDSWVETLSFIERAKLHSPSLENLLNAHADELYIREARLNYNQSHTEEISLKESPLIIRTAFQCLTRIDQSRAVRNRMTLQEITDIINDQQISPQKVAGILEIFRIEGNTFLKPFITKDDTGKNLSVNDVLDITHESLIRNWKRLNDWAHEEHNNYITFLDFNKQLQRWVESNRSSGYLLPIGPLTFFEKWFDTAKPNKYWLKKYDDTNDNEEAKLFRAEKTINDAREFLKRSSRKLFVSRTVIKYGAGRIATTGGLIMLIVVCTWLYFDFRKKQNDYVIKEIGEKCVRMIKGDKINKDRKSIFLINYERLEPGSYQRIVNDIKNDTNRFDIELRTLINLSEMDNIPSLKNIPFIDTICNNINQLAINFIKNKSGNVPYLNRVIQFGRLLQIFRINGFKTDYADNLLKYYSNSLFSNYIIPTLSGADSSFNQDNIVPLFGSIELLLNEKCEQKKIDSMISMISPLESNGDANRRFSNCFNKNNKLKLDWAGLTLLTHNGGYQLLAYLYACKGENQKLIRCIDSLVLNNKDYKDYDNENFSNILSYSILYGTDIHTLKNSILPEFLRLTGCKPAEIFTALTNNFDELLNEWSVYRSSQQMAFENFNKYFISFARGILWNESFENYSIKYKDKDELNYILALKHKQKGFQSVIIDSDSLAAIKEFNISLKFYSNLSESFKLRKISFRNNNKNVSNSQLFLYPYYLNIDDKSEINFEWLFDNNVELDVALLAFQKYILLQHDYTAYKSEDDFRILNNYLMLHYWKFKSPSGNHDKICYDFFDVAQNIINTNPNAEKSLDQQFIIMVECVRAFERKDSSEAYRLLNILDKETIFSSEYLKKEDLKFNAVAFLFKCIAQELAFRNDIANSFIYINSYSLGHIKRNALTDLIINVQDRGMEDISLIYLDSLCNEIEESHSFAPLLLYSTGKVGSNRMYDYSNVLLKEIRDDRKSTAIEYYIKGISGIGYYYKAYKSIPDYASEVNEFTFYNKIIENALLTKMENNKKANAQYVNIYKYFDQTDWENNFLDSWGDDFEMAPGSSMRSSTIADRYF